jgi:hypothetical protein
LNGSVANERTSEDFDLNFLPRHYVQGLVVICLEKNPSAAFAGGVWFVA